MTAPLDLDALSELVQPLDTAAAAATRERLDSLARSPDALGRLDDLTVWLASAQGADPPRDPDRARVVVFAGEHGIALAGVSAYPPEATAWQFSLATSGRSAVSSLARTVGAGIRLLDLSVDLTTSDELSKYKIRRGSGRIDTEDALTLAEAEQAFRNGLAIADEEVDGGADLLIPGELGVGGTTVAAVLVAALTDSEPVKVIGRGSGIDDRAWMRKIVAIRDGLRRARPFTGDPLALLAVAGGADVAAMTGFLVQAAVRRTPVLLDGVMSAAAALVASSIAPGAAVWWRAAHRSGEPAQAIALKHLNLEPVLDLGIRAGEGAGGLAVLPLIRAAVRACSETSTAEDAGLPRIDPGRAAPA
ncbi:MAG TPA: nicotinate-nucleotide--dimethylbenzimidazole phosphoribosyltransferase [Mycobacteriales bacterium]|nr:nicotinate-nucleotide--dimethylbenzimidazole phosphoribosyltransferase [Mycobacteriales bacterium]